MQVNITLVPPKSHLSKLGNQAIDDYWDMKIIMIGTFISIQHLKKVWCPTWEIMQMIITENKWYITQDGNN